MIGQVLGNMLLGYVLVAISVCVIGALATR